MCTASQFVDSLERESRRQAELHDMIAAPKDRALTDEFIRLGEHKLETCMGWCKQFVQDAWCVVACLNVRSQAKHARGVEHDMNVGHDGNEDFAP
ncbi:hypothetical protein HPB50_001571 [Hyalomma asiaticum]|uniref:Uncharacterized protein n=1 Tax=Hyalomma asiaticum TaxID=266040 RepID=A0ACB7SJJ3_HYAAI|nr:hypothetical protein HPB50_001571 [Hyalomma asiaticum]